MFLYVPLDAQVHSIQGYVMDEFNTPLVGAHLHDEAFENSAITNNEGYFQVQLPLGLHHLQCSYVGYQDHVWTIEVDKDTFFVITLQVDTLATVIVTSQKGQSRHDQLSVTNLPMQTLDKIPTLMGEQDILKALTFFPGVGTGVEGKSDITVRGGTSDQNLILYDDIPLYSSGHLLGFISIFNPYAVKSVNLYKGHFPPHFGGRLSSVIDVVSKDGSTKQIRGAYSLGLINSQAHIDGPMWSERTTFSASARFANLGLILLPTKILYRTGRADTYGNFSMYDLNTTVKHRFNDRSSLSFSLLNGSDRGLFINGDFEDVEGRADYKWKNNLMSLKHVFTASPNWFVKTSVFLTNYTNIRELTNTFDIDSPENTESVHFSDQSSLLEYGFRHDNEVVVSAKSNLKVGVFLSRFDNKSNKVTKTSSIDDSHLTAPGLGSDLTQGALYTDWTYYSNKFEWSMGARMSIYTGRDLSTFKIEPRSNIAYQLGGNQKLSLSYARLTQPLHYIGGLTTDLPTFSWVVAQDQLGISTSDNFSLGYSHTLSERGLLAELALFRRQFRGLSDYPLGVQFSFDPDQSVLDKLEVGGKGRAFGLEVLLRKSKGNLQGWLSLTASKSERRFAEINNGDWYPTQYHRRIDAKLFLHYQLTSNHSLSTNIVWTSGNPITFPEGFAANHPDFYSQNTNAIYKRKHNAYTPNYFRLDFQYVHTYKTKKDRDGKLILGVYNASGHTNPLTLDVNTIRTIDSQQDISVQGQLTKTTLFNFIPYVSIGREF